MKKLISVVLTMISLNLVWGQTSVAATDSSAIQNDNTALTTPVVTTVPEKVDSINVSTIPTVAAAKKDSLVLDTMATVKLTASMKQDIAKSDILKADSAVAITLAEGIKGHFTIRNQQDSIVADITKKQGMKVSFALMPGFYSIGIEQRRELLLSKQTLIPGQKISIAEADIERTLKNGLPVTPHRPEKDSASTVVTPKKDFNGSFVSFEMAWVIPVGDAGRFSLSKFPDEALGMESGGYIGIAHNSNLIEFADLFGVGFYGQWGLQANALSDKYKDYYDMSYFGYNLGYTFRTEYEIGPSVTFALGHKMSVDAYFKAGIAFAFLPAFDYIYDNSEDEETADIGESSDSDYNPWEDETTASAFSHDIGGSFGFGFAYGFGVKFRFSILELGVDVNLGKQKFNGDYDGIRLPASCVRLILGGAF
jgi:hypothetical protein